ncbi:MAG TPA: SRPBCC domain-containing protein, partial [Ktedonobacterales bacterium]
HQGHAPVCLFDFEEGISHAMEFKGTHHFNAAPQAVWDGLHNPAVLKAAMPGIQEIAWQGESAINVRANVSMGPVSREFNGTLPVTEHTAPSHLKIEINRDMVKGSVVVDLAADGTGTLLSYNANVDISGPLGPMAAMAQPLVKGQVDKVFANLDAQIH